MPEIFLPKKNPVVNAVTMQGVIAARAGPRGISFTSIEPHLIRAFTKGKPDAVALVVNSPGGSPTQSNLIGQLIDDLATKYKVPVLSFAEDVAASGGYWLLTAGQEIYADPASIVGSIGVVSGQFGLHQFIEKHGIERRLYTAGTKKARLDMFSKADPADVAYLTETLHEIHVVFKDHVKSKRGEKIKKEHEERVFSGDFFTGAKGVELGLVDGIGSLRRVAISKFGENVKINHLNARPRFALFPWTASSIGAGTGAGGGSDGSLASYVLDEMLETVESRVEERFWRSRVGL